MQKTVDGEYDRIGSRADRIRGIPGEMKHTKSGAKKTRGRGGGKACPLSPSEPTTEGKGNRRFGDTSEEKRQCVQ